MFQGIKPVTYYKDNGKPHTTGSEWRLDLPHVQYGGVFETESASALRIIADMACISDTQLVCTSSFQVLDYNHFYHTGHSSMRWAEKIVTKEFHLMSRKEYFKMKLKLGKMEVGRTNPILFAYDHSRYQHEADKIALKATTCVINYKASLNV